MTVLTTAILEEEKPKAEEVESSESAPLPLITTKPAPPLVANIHRPPSRKHYRVFLFIITLIGLLCALGGVCYGVYHFAKIGHSNRLRVFCGVISGNRPPMKRARIISEEVEISVDREAVSLFVPPFTYSRRVFSSSVVLYLENHGITVIKVEKSQTCFVKKVQRRRKVDYSQLSLPYWYRRVEEGSYLPNVRVMQRNWIAKTPHMTHEEAGTVFHPRVAKFCEEMKVYRIIDIRERLGVVRYGGGLLPRCPLRVPCRVRCRAGFTMVYDRNGCRTCHCERCKPQICTFGCKGPKKIDKNGCRRCECAEQRIRGKRAVAEKPAEHIRCEKIRVAEGMEPWLKEKSFLLDSITLCTP